VTVGIRPATPHDRSAINGLLRRSLAAGDDPRYDRFLEWKHRENPFGPSYEWVATEGGEVVGYRAFLRWEFVVDGDARPAVRAVDTATDPAHQGKGIFRELTLHAVEQMAADGVAWVFNTPNDASRPGYLKMGWSVVGRVPVRVRPRSPFVLRHVRGARQAAERWSEEVDGFEPAVDALATVAVPTAANWSTHRTAAFFRWRYGLDDLHYYAAGGPAGTVVVFRVRRRGPLREALIADVVGSGDGLGRVTRQILRSTRADVAVLTGGTRLLSAVPAGGPQLTWRPLADDRVPAMADLHLTGGDVELF